MLSESAKQIAGRLDYVKIGDRVPFPETWKRLLSEWCSAMDDYIKQSQDMCGWVRERGGDLPYWYAKEETNIGFLAAAAWRLGGVALQEFEVTRPEGKGQGDLWIKLGELGCHIEAKGTDSPTTSKDAVEQALSKAKNQLILPPNEKANVGMAACFVVPAITGSTFDFRELAAQFEGDDSIVAVYLPDRTLDLQYEEHNYPGVALIGQVVWPK